ncbi:hypothetical protein OIV70_25665, partial [Burkholderia pseudomallei]|nr:hypothetical protein [Burkholderia pseudomallei]
MEAWQMTSMVSLVAVGMGVALLPAQVRNSTHPGVVYKMLDNDTEHLELKIAVAWHPDRMSAGLQSMLSVPDVELPWRAPSRFAAVRPGPRPFAPARLRARAPYGLRSPPRALPEARPPRSCRRPHRPPGRDRRSSPPPR